MQRALAVAGGSPTLIFNIFNNGIQEDEDLVLPLLFTCRFLRVETQIVMGLGRDRQPPRQNHSGPPIKVENHLSNPVRLPPAPQEVQRLP